MYMGQMTARGVGVACVCVCWGGGGVRNQEGASDQMGRLRGWGRERPGWRRFEVERLEEEVVWGQND